MIYISDLDKDNGYSYEHEAYHHHENSHEHADEHSHEHSHGYGLSHKHTHDHEHQGAAGSKDEMTLRVLLEHWVEHNQSHENDFRKWSEKAKAMKKDETAIYIEKAVELIDRANEMLLEAKAHL